MLRMLHSEALANIYFSMKEKQKANKMRRTRPAFDTQGIRPRLESRPRQTANILCGLSGYPNIDSLFVVINWDKRQTLQA